MIALIYHDDTCQHRERAGALSFAQRYICVEEGED